MIEHQVLVNWQVMMHITTHVVPCLDSSHIELPIIKHDGNDIVIAMGSCDVFRKLRNPFFIVIIRGTQDIAHPVSLRAHIRMRSMTLWQSYIAATLLQAIQWRHHNTILVMQNSSKCSKYKYDINPYVLMKITRRYESSLILIIFPRRYRPPSSFHHLKLPFCTRQMSCEYRHPLPKIVIQ